MCSPMALGKRAVCVTASIPLRCVSFLSTSSKAKDTAATGNCSKNQKKEQRNNMSTQTAILAGGCFWGMQDLLRRYPGVISTRVGYTGGGVPHPPPLNNRRPPQNLPNNFYPPKKSHPELLVVLFSLPHTTTPKRPRNRY